MKAVLPYYVNELRARCIELAAKDDGPVVWPKFGFDFQVDNADILEELRNLAHSHGLTGTWRRARDYIYYATPSGTYIGQEAIRAVQREVIRECNNPQASMPMILELDDLPTLQWLQQCKLL